MPWLRLLRTTAFRIVLIQVGLFAVAAAALIALLYFYTAGLMSQQGDTTILAEAQDLAAEYRAGGSVGLRRAIVRRTIRGGEGIYLLANEDRLRLAGNLDAWPPVREAEAGWVTFRYARAREGGFTLNEARARAIRLTDGGRTYHLLVGRDVQALRDLEGLFTTALPWAFAFIVAMGLAGGVLVGRNMLSRLDAVNRTSDLIMAGDFGERVPLKGSGDEFDQLASNLNRMLDQIGRLMTGMRETADAIAHDLRTPLNRLRTGLEVALTETRDDAAAQRIEAAIAEADRLIATFNALLLIAEAESGALRDAFETLNLGEIAGDVIELYEPLAEERAITLTLVPGAPVRITGHRSLLSQALANLIDNALKYTPEGGAVRVEARATTSGGAEIAVSDTGPGIPADARERVLERFVRLEASRSAPGSGLGLSLVAAVARLHGGRIALEDAGPGLRARLVLPLQTPRRRG